MSTKRCDFNGTTTLDEVAAVIIERNGELSVLSRNGTIDPELMENVVGDDGAP